MRPLPICISRLEVGASPAKNMTPLAPRVKLAISSYSYWHFRDPKMPIEDVIDRAAALGVEGVEILHRQMDSEERAYVQNLKRRAFVNGLDLICLSIHQNFVSPDKNVRQEQIDHTLRCIELAYALGIPCIRINSGRWNTVSFDELMALRGEEPALPGYSDDDAFNWCIECMEACMSKSARMRRVAGFGKSLGSHARTRRRFAHCERRQFAVARRFDGYRQFPRSAL